MIRMLCFFSNQIVPLGWDRWHHARSSRGHTPDSVAAGETLGCLLRRFVSVPLPLELPWGFPGALAAPPERCTLPLDTDIIRFWWILKCFRKSTQTLCCFLVQGVTGVALGRRGRSSRGDGTVPQGRRGHPRVSATSTEAGGCPCFDRACCQPSHTQETIWFLKKHNIYFDLWSL